MTEAARTKSCKNKKCGKAFPLKPKGMKAAFCSASCHLAYWRRTQKDLARAREELAKREARHREGLARNEWYSPADVVEAARMVMGGIDLDPASCEAANEIVHAGCIFTAEGNGLMHSWWGRVWLNPPYGKLGPRFVRKLAAEVRDGDVEQACVVLAAAHLTSNWFHDAVDGLDPIMCITRGRLRFFGPNRRSRPTHGSVVIGLGVSQQRFAEAFGPLGIVTLRNRRTRA